MTVSNGGRTLPKEGSSAKFELILGLTLASQRSFLWKTNEHFPIYLIGNPINVSWNPQNMAHFSKMITLRGHMPMFTLKMNVFPSISLETPQMCWNPQNMAHFSQDDQFEGSHAYVYSKNEHFPIYLLRNPINVCWNPQNMAHISEMINLRGHMPRFTLKAEMFSHLAPCEIAINVTVETLSSNDWNCHSWPLGISLQWCTLPRSWLLEMSVAMCNCHLLGNTIDVSSNVKFPFLTMARCSMSNDAICHSWQCLDVYTNVKLPFFPMTRCQWINPVKL